MPEQYQNKEGNNSIIEETEEHISRIQSKYAEMSESEKRIADYLLAQNGGNDRSINELAAATNSSVSTIVRFCKTLGFKGYAEFKFYAQKGILTPIGSNVKISANDSAGAIKQKVAEFAKNAINNSIVNTDNDQLDQAIAALTKAKQIIVCGNGSAYGIATIAANAFMNLGIPSYAISEPLKQIRTVSFADENSLVIGITNCGYVKDVVDAMMIAKKKGAMTICITGRADSLVTKYADIVLCTTLRDNQSLLDLPTTNICQMITLHTLQIGFIARNSEKLLQNIKNLYDISELQRYDLDIEEVETKRVRI